ncbi:MAG: Holliday junction resolvase RuvX [Planctomycetota bacterium]|nr:Holliday junction resolvase RuvX [Planctomycetota bacterium]
MIGRTLAIDYGLKRTGLASCDPLGITAQPLAAIVSSELEQTVKQIVELVKSKQIVRLLIGMPYLPDGREGEQAQNVHLFTDACRKALPADFEIVHQDERHTTKEAHMLLKETGLKGKKKKAVLDSTAAVVILREFLATNC